MAMELSQKEWKLGFSVGPGQAPRLRSVARRDLGGLIAEIQLARERFGLGEGVDVEKHFAGKRTNENPQLKAYHKPPGLETVKAIQGLPSVQVR